MYRSFVSDVYSGIQLRSPRRRAGAVPEMPIERETWRVPTARPARPRLSTITAFSPVGSLVGTSGDTDIDASIEKLLRSR